MQFAVRCRNLNSLVALQTVFQNTWGVCGFHVIKKRVLVVNQIFTASARDHTAKAVWGLTSEFE